ncbi:MAG: SpoIIE family protein phosphatase [Chloroflexi bacterium]|nr:SpoIIE family protein phosphatase [Chloroflexota bacterium]
MSFVIGVATRPYPGECVSGDDWLIDIYEGICRLTVLDALGHGPAAAAVAQIAKEAIAARPDLDPMETLRVGHGALTGTRGAAISVATLDPTAGRLTFAGISNVEGSVFLAGRQERLITYRGIVGSASRTVRPFDHSLVADWLLIVHTDGVSNRFDLDQLAGVDRHDVQALADAILARWARKTDDATVLVARSA